jgi:hypothetical protein
MRRGTAPELFPWAETPTTEPFERTSQVSRNYNFNFLNFLPGFTELCGLVVVIPSSYLEGSWFESLPPDDGNSYRGFNPSRQFLNRHLQIDRDGLPQSLTLHSLYSWKGVFKYPRNENLWSYTWLATCNSCNWIRHREVPCGYSIFMHNWYYVFQPLLTNCNLAVGKMRLVCWVACNFTPLCIFTTWCFVHEQSSYH